MYSIISFNYNNKDFTTLAFAIRQEVFVEEQKVSREEEYDEFEKSSIHYLCFQDEKAIAAARWRITDQGIKLERFAVLKQFRNKKAGEAILKAVLADVVPLKKKIYLNAQVAAMNFYIRNNFKAEGEMFSEANIDHFKMIYQF